LQEEKEVDIKVTRSFAEYITNSKVYTKVIGRCGFCGWAVIVAIIKTKTDIKIFEELITRIYLQIHPHPSPIRKTWIKKVLCIDRDLWKYVTEFFVLDHEQTFQVAFITCTVTPIL